MKKKENTSNDKVILQDIIDNQNEKIRTLESRIENLQDQLETAYGVNNGLLEEQKDDENYRNLPDIIFRLRLFNILPVSESS